MDIASRLAAASGVQKLPNRALDLFVLRNWLSEGECVALCGLIDAHRRPSTIADDQGISGFRTSETCDLDSSERLVATIRDRLCALTGIADNQAEPLQGQRYAAGQEFRPHTDSFNPDGADYYLHCAEAGQRTWTAMIYLNQPAAGGGTRFKSIGKIIQPETGKLLVWNNLLTDGTPNAATLHQGMKVRKGTKYVLTLWYRERPLG
ncbi:2OG-Fe(II) oxygenase [Sphingomonas sp.]|uniref:prolyl hydroxylase family protein n=1 Tax=Sphingomonas sp. TaxID=28214 RepID=UPI0025DF8237|nr:2OG-Fe(II) oxygenase [Sphingomonas sp.]